MATMDFTAKPLALFAFRCWMCCGSRGRIVDDEAEFGVRGVLGSGYGR